MLWKHSENCLIDLIDACVLKIRFRSNYHNYAMKTELHNQSKKSFFGH